MATKISVIIPTYNVESKISRCFKSLDNLKKTIDETEVIFVDDHSDDETFELVKAFQQSRPWVKTFRLDANTGSPSAPRNFGLKHATGEYVFHLDPDDEILPTGVKAEIAIADETNCDAVRAPLRRCDGQRTITMNEIPEWDSLATQEDRHRAIVRKHSTTVCSLYRRRFLIDYSLQWPEDLRLAEDAIYLYTVISKGRVEYSSEPDFIYYVEYDQGTASSTQQYQDRELDNHIRAWKQSSEILKSTGIDYMELRGQVALQTAFHNMIRFNRGGLSHVKLAELQTLLNANISSVSKYTYGPRFKELLDLLIDGQFSTFNEKIKLRVLIAGYDLRFILPAVPYLSELYDIRVDEWTGHETHDEEKSRRLLNWADVIHCEWMLGNTVWYTKNKLPRQTIQARLHRFETSRNYGLELERENLNRVITIAPGMFEETQAVFNFPREIVCYAPNYIFTGAYAISDDPNKVFNLVMVGSVPIRKGYRLALELLKMLHSIDPRYNLTVYGKRPDELGWVIRDPRERDYFAECDRFIRSNGLESIVKFGGWVDTKQELADKGFILSLSEAEGSHVAAAEGFASHNITLLRPWEGAEYMYPEQYIFDTLEEMRDYVLECRDYEVFKQRSQAGIEYVESRYSMARFVENFARYLPIPTRVV